MAHRSRRRARRPGGGRAVHLHSLLQQRAERAVAVAVGQRFALLRRHRDGGYRVNEVLLGQNATAVGRTTSVTGHLTIQGTSATAASFSVPMATVHSDKSQRDDQFDGRIMDVAQYPTATFTLTSPVDLAPLPATGAVKSYTAHGKLTLHGTTRAVTITLTAERVGAQLKVAGQIPVLFSDYNIQNPSLGGFVTTQDHGLLEFLLVFARASEMGPKK